MLTATHYVLIVLGGLVLMHQISFRLLWSPAKYKERVTLRAAHNAFGEDPESLPQELQPYEHTLSWRRLLNLYELVLHRDAPARFAELRKIWGLDEENYHREVCHTLPNSITYE